MFFVYIIECRDDSLYTGYTTDLGRRINEHESCDKKSAKYVRTKGFKQLLYSEELATLSLALKREAEIKKFTRSKKLALINKK